MSHGHHGKIILKTIHSVVILPGMHKGKIALIGFNQKRDAYFLSGLRPDLNKHPFKWSKMDLKHKCVVLTGWPKAKININLSLETTNKTVFTSTLLKAKSYVWTGFKILLFKFYGFYDSVWIRSMKPWKSFLETKVTIRCFA